MSQHHPDRRSPLVFEVRELGRRVGAIKRINTTVPAPADLIVGVIGVPQDSDVELDLTLQSVSEGVLASGTASVQLRGQCARCLDEISDEGSFDLQELYFYPGNEVDEEESVVEDDTIDLEEALRDAVVLELPFTPLCEEDCLGLCPDCGFNRNLDPGHGHGEQVDPRWSQLSGLAGDTNN